MARRKYRYTWSDVPYIECDWINGWPDGGAFNGYSGKLETSGSLLQAHAEHDKARDVFSVFYVSEDADAPTRANILLERRPQARGGARVYFIAPCCGRSVRKLALLPYGVACGRCGSITQEAQRKGRIQRMIHKADMLAGRLGCDTWHSEPKKRPHGMHRETFVRLCEQHAAAVQAAYRVIGPRIARATASRGAVGQFTAMVKWGL